MNPPSQSSKRRRATAQGITAIALRGYKSLAEECSVEVRPLTILAGANSSGKSSIMQPLLLLKQTLEANYDPGALLLDGPNVRFTSTEQFLSRLSGRTFIDNFTIKIEVEGTRSLSNMFRRQRQGIELLETTYDDRQVTTLRRGMSHDDIVPILPRGLKRLQEQFVQKEKGRFEWRVERIRCFLALQLAEKDVSHNVLLLPWFKRREDGVTEVTSADLDGAGAFGDWPEDFAEVALTTESRYLDAAELRQSIR